MTLGEESVSMTLSAVSIVPPTESELVNEVLMRYRGIFSTKMTLVNIAHSLQSAANVYRRCYMIKL